MTKRRRSLKSYDTRKCQYHQGSMIGKTEWTDIWDEKTMDVFICGLLMSEALEQTYSVRHGFGKEFDIVSPRESIPRSDCYRSSCSREVEAKDYRVNNTGENTLAIELLARDEFWSELAVDMFLETKVKCQNRQELSYFCLSSYLSIAVDDDDDNSNSTDGNRTVAGIPIRVTKGQEEENRVIAEISVFYVSAHPRGKRCRHVTGDVLLLNNLNG